MVPPTDAPLSAGGGQAGSSIAGRYRLVRPLAIGGMARVWEGFDEVLGRPVAVKVLHDHLASDPTFLARFRREAISAARLSHPAIVSVYDTCSDDGVEAIVMELVRGTDLRKRLDERGAMPVDEAIRIGRAVAAALAHAHAAGLVHRDVKPGNVLLSEDDRVLVTDFGIAKAGEGTDLTAEATMLGTAKYLAPEQVQGHPVDARSDVYGLGVVLYEALTGSVPFRGDSEAATALLRLQQDPPMLRERRPEVPEGVASVVMRCLARRPEDRWPTATALREALAAAAGDGGPGPGPSGPASGPATVAMTTASPAPAPAPEVPSPAPPPADLPDAPPVAAAAVEAATVGWGSAEVGDAQPAPDAVSPPAQDVYPGSGPGGPRLGRRVGPVAVVGLLLAAAAVLAMLVVTLPQGEGGDPRLARAQAYDPTGDGAEHDDEAALAIDGDLETGWTTETYNHPDVTRLKPGVGLVVTLEERARVREVRVSSSTPGWRGAVYGVDGSLPDDIVGWGEPLATTRGTTGERTTFTVDDTVSRILIWFTRVGDDGVAMVNEVEVG